MADDGTKRLLLLRVRMLPVMCLIFPFCGFSPHTLFVAVCQRKIALLFADGLKSMQKTWYMQAAAAEIVRAMWPHLGNLTQLTEACTVPPQK